MGSRARPFEVLQERLQQRLDDVGQLNGDVGGVNAGKVRLGNRPEKPLEVRRLGRGGVNENVEPHLVPGCGKSIIIIHQSALLPKRKGKGGGGG